MNRPTLWKHWCVLAPVAAAVLAAGCAPPTAGRTQAAGPDAAELARSQRMNVTRAVFGSTPDGAAVDLYTLDNGRGMKARVITYGATLTAVEVPDRTGKTANVVLYMDTLEQYLAGAPAASVIGRFANRIGGAKFTLDGVEYKLAANSGPNHIHGGRTGFQKAVWKAEPAAGDGWVGVRLTHTSPDGDEGYPGTLAVTVTYMLTAGGELGMEYAATTDKPTIVNLTNHAYWNLAGAGAGDVLAERLTVNADRYLAADAALIPSGELLAVEGTPLDFRAPHAIGDRIGDLAATHGYDHCYVLNKEPGELSPAARLAEPSSGRVMEVWTTYPGMQLYTANHLNGKLKAGGRAYEQFGAVCFETQYFPDSPNHPNFPPTVLRPGETYRHVTVYRFSVEK